MAVKRKTDPCPCGSGQQYRYCHGKPPEAEEPTARVQRKPVLFLAMVLICAPLAYVASWYSGDAGRPGTIQVWSEEHGHYHTVDAVTNLQVRPDQPVTQPSEAPDAGAEAGEATADAPVLTEPPGPAPPGKEWSAEHAHWHSIDGPTDEVPRIQDPLSGTTLQREVKLERPPGPAPEGKVWSEAHAHWHDADNP